MSDAALYRMTKEIARRHGCDRGTFTVCWGEYERGEVCQCKEDARAALAKVSQQQGTPQSQGQQNEGAES